MKFLSLIFFELLPAFNINNNDVIAKMHKKYAGKWMSSFRFTQTTEAYRNDSLISTSTWYENVVYPDQFRIDFGDKTSGNTAIFTKDSVYRFRQGKLVRTTANEDNLTFLLGGMFFYSLDTVKAMLARMGFDPAKSYETKMENKPVYVIGAGNAEEKTNQLWIDKEKLILVKFTRYENDQKEEGKFFDHKQFGNSWSETACDFYVNDTLIQKEKYYDCKANPVIDPRIFDPHNFILAN